PSTGIPPPRFVTGAFQFVLSVSSINAPTVAAPVVGRAGGPDVAEAQFVGRVIRIVLLFPDLSDSRNRCSPYPGACTMNSYVPGANLATSPRLIEPVVAGFVSAIGETLASYCPTEVR